MSHIGLHCSHEQIPPSRLLDHVGHAETSSVETAAWVGEWADEVANVNQPRQWGTNVFPPPTGWGLETTEQSARLGEHVRPGLAA